MSMLSVKTAPVLQDRTLQQAASYVECMETVLFERPESLDSLETEEVDNAKQEMVKLMESQAWPTFLEKLHDLPEGASFCDQNNILHHVCKNGAPLDVIMVVVAMHQDSVKTMDSHSFLPIHWSCKSKAPAAVFRFLLETYPESSWATTKEDMLPLHLATKQALDTDVLMTLMAVYPEATVAKDIFGITPLDYARNIELAEFREPIVKCLELGPWMSNTLEDMHARFEKLHGHYKNKFQKVTYDTNMEIVNLRVGSEIKRVEFKEEQTQKLNQFISKIEAEKEKSLKETEDRIATLQATSERKMKAVLASCEAAKAMIKAECVAKLQKRVSEHNEAIKRHKDIQAKQKGNYDAKLEKKEAELEEAIKLHNDIQAKQKGEYDAKLEKKEAEHNEAIKDIQAKQKAEYEAQLEKLNEKLEAQEKEHNEIQAKQQTEIESLKSDVSDQDAQISELAQTIEAGTVEHTTALEEEWRRIDMLQLELTSTGAELTVMTDKFDNANEKNKAMREELETKERDFSLALDEIGSLKKRLAQLDTLMVSIKRLTDKNKKEEVTTEQAYIVETPEEAGSISRSIAYRKPSLSAYTESHDSDRSFSFSQRGKASMIPRPKSSMIPRLNAKNTLDPVLIGRDREETVLVENRDEFSRADQREPDGAVWTRE